MNDKDIEHLLAWMAEVMQCLGQNPGKDGGWQMRRTWDAYHKTVEDLNHPLDKSSNKAA